MTRYAITLDRADARWLRSMLEGALVVERGVQTNELRWLQSMAGDNDAETDLERTGLEATTAARADRIGTLERIVRGLSHAQAWHEAAGAPA